jgi:hypothetical protein
MIIRFEVHCLRLPDSDGPVHEIGLIIVVDCRHGFVLLVELDEGKAPFLFCDLIDGYLNGLDFSKGVEEGEEHLLCDFLGQVAHIDSPFVIFLVHLL